jgi:hypothetical protein
MSLDTDVEVLFQNAEYIPWKQSYRDEIIPEGELRAYEFSSTGDYEIQKVIILSQNLDLAKDIIGREIESGCAFYKPFSTIEEKPLREGMLAECRYCE